MKPNLQQRIDQLKERAGDLKIPLLVGFALAVVVVGLLGWRGMKSSEPPVQFWGDMADQAKWKAQQATTFYADGRTQRTPPPNTVPWGRDTDQPDRRNEQVLADLFALERAPGAWTRERLDQGRIVYKTYCALCHGDAGDGLGVTTKYGMNQPPAYTLERLRDATDGYLFQIITNGKGQMAPLRGRIPVEDRWAAVGWLRVLQKAGHSDAADLPDTVREGLPK